MQLTDESESHSTALRSVMDARFRGPLMTFFSRRIKNRLEAEDLTQEVFVRLIGTTGTNQIKNEAAYVFTIARNLLRDRYRHGVRRSAAGGTPIEVVLISELDGDFVESRSPERVLLGRELLSDTLRALEDLGERTRDIFVQFRLENMKQRDIAALYGIGQSTVEKHVTKAVLHLAARFNRSSC